MLRKNSLLENSHDTRSLIWSFGLFPSMPLLAVYFHGLSLSLWPVALYLGFSAGVLSHYHNHRSVFRVGWLNDIYSVWLSVFYGFPIFAWIPTHNQNHHKYVNGPGDATRTSRTGRSDSLFTALVYPIQSSAWQLPALRRYFEKLRQRSPRRLAWAIVQCGALVVLHACFWALAVAHNGLEMGSRSYGLLVAMPALFASWSMMFINYVQHVGCDPDSKDNHSRNFVGAWENWLVFDAGLHTVHHENPGLHWSTYRELHRARAATIDPKLCQRNVLTFVVQQYLLPRRIDLKNVESTGTRRVSCTAKGEEIPEYCGGAE